jgi:hypothetical protein
MRPGCSPCKRATESSTRCATSSMKTQSTWKRLGESFSR